MTDPESKSPGTTTRPEWPKLRSFREEVRRIRGTLHAKAKQEPKRRFQHLFADVRKRAVLAVAYVDARDNNGAPGNDGETFERIEEQGCEKWLRGIEEELQQGTYVVGPVRRVRIPKGNGDFRPLGIPNIRDRVVQGAVRLILEAILEIDFPEEMFGYRPKKNGLGAVEMTHKLLSQGYVAVVDMDFKGYFDSIDHRLLLGEVRRRVADPQVLRVLKMFLRAPVVDVVMEQGAERVVYSRNRRGTPQGGVISPLLANVFMAQFYMAWRDQGMDEKFQGRIVSYADDAIVLVRQRADEVLAWLRQEAMAHGLTLHPAKTRVLDARVDSFDFPGYTSIPVGTNWKVRPSKNKVVEFKEVLAGLCRTPFGPRTISRLNEVLRGWAAYYSYGDVHDAHVDVDHHVATLLHEALLEVHGHHHPDRGSAAGSREFLEELGVVSLVALHDHRVRELGLADERAWGGGGRPGTSRTAPVHHSGFASTRS